MYVEQVDFVFFFQAEDGIRDYKVTGVQTCALPISVLSRAVREVAPKLAASTWGARLEPPMPHTTTCVSPSRRTAAAKRVSSCHCASEARGASIQPRWLIGRQKHNPPSPPVRQALRLAHEAARGSRDCNRPPLARRRRVRGGGPGGPPAPNPPAGTGEGRGGEKGGV